MSDKGYGNFGNMQKERQRNSEYPYTEESDPVEYDSVDPSVKRKIKKKTANFAGKTDFHSKLGTDKFYFVGGNTKLSDCFIQPGVVLEKIVSFARMINPVPGMYKGKKTAGGSSFPNGVGNFQGIGMTAGWASAPPDFDDAYLEKYEEEDDNLDLDSYVYKKDAENY